MEEKIKLVVGYRYLIQEPRNSNIVCIKVFELSRSGGYANISKDGRPPTWCAVTNLKILDALGKFDVKDVPDPLF